MFGSAQIYDISFVLSNRRKRTKPCFEFIIKEDQLEKIIRQLQRIADRSREHVQKHLPYTSFFLPTKDLFGNREFGYSRCGLVTISDGYATFAIELKPQNLEACAFTLNLLVFALCISAEDVPLSNRSQQIEIETNCDPSRFTGYGYAAGGYLSADVCRWFSKQCKGHEKAEVPDIVVRAMQEAWRAVSEGRVNKGAANQCRGSLRRDGRFILECPGNACDLAIYPEQLYGGIERNVPVRFSCHNLDTAQQQLTLLAGLAKLCELAREDTDT